jgi:hypothetical protein
MPIKRKYKISVARIQQISNDITEDMGSYTKSELIEVAKYYADQLYNAEERFTAFRTDALKIAVDMAFLVNKRRLPDKSWRPDPS